MARDTSHRKGYIPSPASEYATKDTVYTFGISEYAAMYTTHTPYGISDVLMPLSTLLLTPLQSYSCILIIKVVLAGHLAPETHVDVELAVHETGHVLVELLLAQNTPDNQRHWWRSSCVVG